MHNDIISMLRNSDLDRFSKITQIKGGRNSKVFLINVNENKYVIKKYFQSNNENNNRLVVEYNFLELLNSFEVKNVPTPINKDEKNSLGLYSFVEGKKILKPNMNDIKKVTDFLKQINSIKINKMKLSNAKESCFSIEEHLIIINKRFEKILSIIKEYDSNTPIHEFVTKKLLIKKNKIIDNILKIFNSNEIEEKFFDTKIIVSPSDFGFHNILSDYNKLNFLDFEYAGLDDPAKLICDFYCQPDIPINKDHFKFFINTISYWLPDFENVYRRFTNLLPLYRLKWCLIMLNEFTHDGIERRTHANNKNQNLPNVQLEKSFNYFDKHLEKV